MAILPDSSREPAQDATQARSISTEGPKGRGRADKREAITRAARIVFGRDGYSRTSIDAIATEAGVSTRTIYNHFEDKEQLFSGVLHASASQVADGFTANVERHLTGTDLRSDLLALGRAFAAQGTDFPEHFAMVGQIMAEAPHFPSEIIDAWQQAGPLRVQGEVAGRLEQLADRGLLRVSDPTRAAIHFSALVTAGIPKRRFDGSPPPSNEQVADVVAAGVDVFLSGYGADSRAASAEKRI